MPLEPIRRWKDLAHELVDAPPKKERRQYESPLARQLASIAKRLQATSIEDFKIGGRLLDAMLDGYTLEAAADVVYLARLIGAQAPATTTWPEVLEFLRTPCGEVLDNANVTNAERAFYEGRGKNLRREMKRSNEYERVLAILEGRSKK